MAHPGKLIALILVVTVAGGSQGFAQSAGDKRVQAIARDLSRQGYREIEVTRTWLGRIRIEAKSATGEREIVVNPRTGEILRDYWEVEDEGEDHRRGLLGGRSQDHDTGAGRDDREQGDDGSDEDGSRDDGFGDDGADDSDSDGDSDRDSDRDSDGDSDGDSDRDSDGDSDGGDGDGDGEGEGGDD